MSFDFAFDPDDQDFQAAIDLRRRHLSEEQIRAFESDIAAIFTAFGLDLNTPATTDTPQRFLRALFDATEGYEGDPKLLKVFETECRGGPDCRLSQVVEGPIQFFSLCEHHALPFYGHAYVGYIAHEHLIGLSKLTRLVRLFAKRFSAQERIGQQIADTWTRCSSPMASPSISKPTTSVPRCGASARSRHSPARRSGVGPTTTMRRCVTCAGCANEGP